MDEDLDKDLEKEVDDFDPEVDDLLTPGKSKAKGDDDTLSLDDLGDEELGALPEDDYDDKDLW